MMPSSSSDKESTPLLFSPKGGGHLDPSNNTANDGPHQRRRAPTQQQQQHYFGGKFDPPKAQHPQTPLTNSTSWRNKRLNHLATTPFIKKLYNSYSIMREHIKPYTRPALDHGRRDEKHYYEDNYNDLSWRCSFGTRHDDGIWVNHGDSPGLIMACLVWLMIVYGGFTVTLLAKNNSLPSFVSITYCTICALALASHAKTTFTDPGSVPPNAVPNEEYVSKQHIVKYCNVCQSYKPPKCHHCRICDRCISGMDHHCPWMNNCIGVGNMKHFLLFLVYVWVASTYGLILFGVNYFFCNSEECIFPYGLVALVRLMTVLCIGAVVFTSNMITSVFWGVMTGMGTIDRMKKQEANTFEESDEPPIPWTDVFGIGSYFTWVLPVDPLFDDYDRVMGYATVDRLEREKDTIL